jgi:Mrp family chromosome partitioning ATPase
MARMLQALKNLEAKEIRPQTNRPASAPAAAAVAAKPSVGATTSADTSSAAAVAPRIMEVVDKLDAVVAHELSGITAPISSPAFAPTPDLAFTGFAYVGQPRTDAALVPSPATLQVIQPAAKAAPAFPAVKAPCELERQIKRTLNDRIRSQPLVDLVDRLVRDMEQSESKVLAFVGLGASDDLHFPILQAAMALAEKRSKRVLLIDGDVARRALSDGLEYGRCPGLGELSAGIAQVANVCQATATKQLLFVPAGQMQPAMDSATEEALEKALGQLKVNFDCVLIDAGGELASALAQASDAAYLVVELGAVETNTAQAALARLRAAGARVLGCIAT